MDAETAIRKLKSRSNRKALDSLARFGSNPRNALGVRLPEIRKIARELGHDHALAAKLWGSGIHEARILASMVEIPGSITEGQMERWVSQLDSWDVCDSLCGNLLDRTNLGYSKAIEWSGRKEEYVKRAGFALMAYIAVHDKGRKDRDFLRLLPIIERESWDDRNFVRKAVNWALRGIGKRNGKLNGAAILSAKRIREQGTRPARWIAADAIRELEGSRVQGRLDGKD